MACRRCTPTDLEVRYGDRHFVVGDGRDVLQVLHDDIDVTNRAFEAYDPIIVGADGWVKLFTESASICECKNLVVEVLRGNVKVVESTGRGVN